MALDDAVKKLPYLKIDENNQPMLNRKHAYYTQVQGQMGVYGIKVCDFVMCTKDDIFVERITFDEGFWKKTCCQTSGILHVNTIARTCVSIAEI